jgi:hypothetical protein
MVVEPDIGTQEFTSYHRRRAEEERQRAGRATDPAVRRVHLELAARHEAALSGSDAPARGGAFSV